MRLALITLLITFISFPCANVYAYGKEKKTYGPKRVDEDKSEKEVEQIDEPAWKDKWVEKKKRTLDRRRTSSGERYSRTKQKLKDKYGKKKKEKEEEDLQEADENAEGPKTIEVEPENSNKTQDAGQMADTDKETEKHEQNGS